MEDLAFARRCIRGDRKSWDEFIARYSRLIYSYIHHCLEFTGLQSLRKEVASDLFQEVFCGLMKDDYKKLRTFKGKGGCSLSSWLKQVTVTISLDYLRRIKPALSLDQEDEDGISLSGIIPDRAKPVRALLADAEKIKHLNECIEALTADDRYFLEMHLHRRVSLESLRRILHVSRGAIDMRRGRIVERLKKCFRGKGFALDF